MKLIVDKMADYVARNGPEFEIVVRRRNDERFRFVETDHPYHAYYLHKKEAFLLVTKHYCIRLFYNNMLVVVQFSRK